MLLSLIGAVGCGFTSIWFLVVAFRKSVLWGVFCLFLPIVGFFFLIVHWPEAKRPFMWSILAWVVLMIGVALGGGRTYFTAY